MSSSFFYILQITCASPPPPPPLLQRRVFVGLRTETLKDSGGRHQLTAAWVLPSAASRGTFLPRSGPDVLRGADSCADTLGEGRFAHNCNVASLQPLSCTTKHVFFHLRTLRLNSPETNQKKTKHQPRCLACLALCLLQGFSFRCFLGSSACLKGHKGVWSVARYVCDTTRGPIYRTECWHMSLYLLNICKY